MAFIILDTSYESIDSEMIGTEHKNISDQGWSQFYTDMEETLLINMPLPQGQAVTIDMFCYATHATDSITRRSITVTIFIIFGTPIIWYTKRQNTIKCSTFGSEFVVLRIAAKLNDALWYKLRMFGIPRDNGSVVRNDKIAI